MKKYTLIIILVAIVGIMNLAIWLRPEPQPVPLLLKFYPSVGDSPLLFNTPDYANPGGSGKFSVRDFQFFISNIKLIADSSTYAIMDSYYLARFDLADQPYTIEILVPSDHNYHTIELGIGVDSKANGNITVQGDLDPNSRMAWSWDVGYKFILLEGNLETEHKRYPLVYHIGFDENYVTTQFVIADQAISQASPRMHFKVDILQLFDTQQPIDMEHLNTVKFDHVDARRIAKGFSTFLSACDRHCQNALTKKPH